MEELNDNLVNDAPIEGQSDAQTQETQEVVDPNWNPQEYTFQYKNQPVIPKSREHLLSLAQKGHGFNDQWDKFKKEQEEFNGVRGQYDKYAQLDKLFQEHPELQSKINNTVYEYQQGITQSQEDLPPELQEARKIHDEVKSIQDSIQSQMADQKLNEEIKQLRTAYPNENWEADDGNGTLEKQLLKHALDTNAPTLEMAFRHMRWPSIQANAAAEALKANQMKTKEAHKAGVVNVGVNPKGGKAPVDVTKLSYNQIADGAINGTL